MEEVHRPIDHTQNVSEATPRFPLILEKDPGLVPWEAEPARRDLYDECMDSLAPLRRWFASDWRRTDGALTAFVLAVTILGLVFPADSIDDRPLDAIGVVIAVVPAFFIPFRRTAPIRMLTAATVLGFAFWVADYPGGGAWPAMAVMLYSAALYLTNRRQASMVIITFTAALLMVLIAGLLVDGEEEITVATIVVNVVLFELAWIAGDTVRQRREHIAGLEARTARAEQDQEQKAALAGQVEHGESDEQRQYALPGCDQHHQASSNQG